MIMCLIPTYTELEKNNQVQKVLHLMTLPVDTEEKRKNFLYNLAFMNNMVVKGYMKERTSMDDVIYATKEAAISFAGQKMPGRCFQCSDVVYIYAAGRQYSFHTKWSFVEIPRKYVKWDHVEGGWNLSDTDYHNAVERIRKEEDGELYQSVCKRKEWERNLQKAVIRQIHRLQRNRQRVEEFKRVMEEKITPAQRRTKTYREYKNDKYDHRWEECWKLWGKKWGFGSCPPETFFYAFMCTGSFNDSCAESYANSYFKKIKSHYNF